MVILHTFYTGLSQNYHFLALASGRDILEGFKVLFNQHYHIDTNTDNISYFQLEPVTD